MGRPHYIRHGNPNGPVSIELTAKVLREHTTSDLLQTMFIINAIIRGRKKKKLMSTKDRMILVAIAEELLGMARLRY